MPAGFTKSGLMVGLGETREEIMQVMDDLRAAKVDFLTIGQYLQPTSKHATLERFWTPEEFAGLESIARAKGFLMVSASPLTRSSYHADSDFAAAEGGARSPSRRDLAPRNPHRSVYGGSDVPRGGRCGALSRIPALGGGAARAVAARERADRPKWRWAMAPCASAIPAR